MSEVKPKLLMIYDYEMPPHQKRVKHSSPYLLEQALKEYFDMYRVGEIEPMQADMVLNTPPLKTLGGMGNDLFALGPITGYWTTSPLEGIGEEYFKDCDILFNAIPSWEHKLPKGKAVTLLDAVDPAYHEYEDTFDFEVGFLGSEIEGTRIDLLNRIAERFSLLRGHTDLGERSARALSRCKIVLSIQDWNWHGAGIERRFFTFGNIRPILIHNTPDFALAGFQEDVHYLGYNSPDECLEKIAEYLRVPGTLEMVGNQLKRKLRAEHMFSNRAKTVYDAYIKYKK